MSIYSWGRNSHGELGVEHVEEADSKDEWAPKVTLSVINE
jgi:alpha-tubulin suppressor-like RCC1 family protein